MYKKEVNHKGWKIKYQQFLRVTYAELPVKLISAFQCFTFMLIKPMLPTLIKEPFDDPDWIYELKWDGYRMIAEIRGGNIQLLSRKGNTFTRFSQLCTSLSKLGCSCILDGEVVVVDTDGRPNFRKLMYSRKEQYTYYVFDILYLKGKNLINLPLVERKELLKNLLPELPDVKYSDHVEGQGIGLFELAKKNDLEGIVAKLKSSAYTEGRSRNWLKVKTWDEESYEERGKMFDKSEKHA